MNMQKELLGTYEVGELLWNIEYWTDRYIRKILYTEYTQLQSRMCKTDCSRMYSYFIALITNLLSTCFVLLQCSICNVCSESPPGSSIESKC
jgi:hypothetical protein